MRRRYNTVICSHKTHDARLVWVEEGEILVIEAWEEPFSIFHDGKAVDVEVVVEHDVRELAFRERQN